MREKINLKASIAEIMLMLTLASKLRGKMFFDEIPCILKAFFHRIKAVEVERVGSASG
jgi:hypothetical protein